MKYVVNWIPLRIRVRSRNTQPHLEERKTLNKQTNKQTLEPKIKILDQVKKRNYNQKKSSRA